MPGDVPHPHPDPRANTHAGDLQKKKNISKNIKKKYLNF
jgi:hypothetical protein